MSHNLTSISAFRPWLKEKRARGNSSFRLNGVASERILSLVEVELEAKGVPLDDYDDVAWLAEQREWLFAVLAKNGVSRSSSASYISRFRRAVRDYLAEQGEAPVRKPTQGEKKPKIPAPLTVAGEISEAFLALERWPHLRKYLLGPLTAAAESLLGNAGKSPIPAPTEATSTPKK